MSWRFGFRVNLETYPQPLKRAFANLITDHQVGMDKITTLCPTFQIRQELAFLISLMVVMVFLTCIPWFWTSRVIPHVISCIQHGSIIDNIAQSTIPNHFCYPKSRFEGWNCWKHLWSSQNTPSHIRERLVDQFEAIPPLNKSGAKCRYFIHASSNEVRERSLQKY